VVSPTFSVGAQKPTRIQALIGVWLANVDAWGVVYRECVYVVELKRL
jgi:hypothetical protein